MGELTRDVLEKLYLEELLTEGEIAQRYGTYQVKISRLRAKWDIPTLSKAERSQRKHPPVTPYQEELLVGSLLGDGWMSTTSETSARFGESHSDKQEAYLRWKAGILEPFTSAIFTTRKREGGREYPGWGMSTCSCPQLRPYYDFFYVNKKRRFPANLPALMTPLALAVWYMDDGSVTTTGSPRIAFGLGITSLNRAKEALRALGLRPRVYGKGSDRVIHFPNQEREFRDLVEPHIIPSMAYKLPEDTPRRQLDRNARKLTSGRATKMYQVGMTKGEIGRAFGVGASTVGRRLKDAGVTMRRSGPRSRNWSRLQAHAALTEYDPARWGSLEDSEKEQWLNTIVEVLRGSGFPTPIPWDRDKLEFEFERLQRLGKPVEGGSFKRSVVGTTACGSYFPNRYEARYRGEGSALEAWHDDKKLRNAVRFQLRRGDPVEPHRVLRAITMQCRTPTVFRPAVAKALYERYCPPGGRVWDPCSGYGGRLFGALAAGVSYVGTDVVKATVEGNLKIAEMLGKSDQVEVHCCPAEDFDPGSVDMVFTSPPYVDREVYSGDVEQSWRRHGTDLEGWLEGFIRPIAQRSRGVLAFNVADLKERRGKERVPLVGGIASTVGVEGWGLVETLAMPLAVVNRHKASEPVLVFRR
jgi:hypothetical protein